MTDPNDTHDTDDEPLYRIDEHGRLTWTDEGIQEWRKPYAKAGINIHRLTTREALQIAAPQLDQQLIDIARSGPKTLERRILIAFATGDHAERKHLERLLERRNRLGLRVV